ncbi:kinase-like domain-containing protein [Nemania sp. FL0916]|nr:kinase-like domain-containing protein [Nemania sp. FL0916]
MGEQDALTALGVLGEWIWGNDLETVVFAQAFGHEKTLIFRFTLDNTQPSQSLTTRIVNCYHDLAVHSPSATFPNRLSMRMAIWSAVATVWSECSDNPTVQDPDIVIDVYDLDSTDFGSTDLPLRTAWALCRENLFNDYINLLLPPSQLAVQPVDTVDFKSLIRLNQLGGRGCTTLVHTPSDPLSQFVFKGIDFRTFLNSYESGHIHEEVKIFYRSMELVSNMPRHPNIIGPAQIVVTICKHGDDRPFVCGSLYPFLPNGSLASHIEKNNASGERIALSCKAQWCYQMAAAVAHTHFVAHTFHMDLKPGNFLLDADSSLVLIDWEQSDAPVTTAAPEIDGTCDVEEIPAGSTTTLRYIKYTGPERRNMPITTPGDNGWNVWNVFLEWSKQCPRALELAEVFSLGRCMWMLLRQPDMDAFEDVTSTEEVVEDWQSSEDIPVHWKQVVQDCLRRDPNERIGLRELTAFWDDARHKMNDCVS